MSRHRNLQGIERETDAVLDEYDGYDESQADELSPEDREQLASGTTQIRDMLGADSDKVTTPQIQEALWYYYYDLDKTVDYLKRKFIAPPPPKPAKKAPVKLPEVLGYPISARLQLPPASYFCDVSWFHVPTERIGELVPLALPRGGLLGGGDASPGKSKLRALAATRKKKADEKKQEEKVGEAGERIGRLSISETAPQAASEMRAQIKRLSITDSPQPATTDSGIPSKRQKVPGGAIPTAGLRAKPVSSLPGAAEPELEEEPARKKPDWVDEECVVVSSKTGPSPFAQTLFGPRPQTSSSPYSSSAMFPLPYTSSPQWDPSVFENPSPDDIVLRAQAQAGKKAASAAKKTSPKASAAKGEVPTDEVKALEISDSVPPPKSKGLDVLKEYEKSKEKRSASFVVVGHVDAGKSTIMGRLLLELKLVDSQTVEKYRRQAEKIGKQSFALAWIMDQRSDERERGVTIDIATNQFETDKTRFTILDAPGHRDFVPNMIAGASQADFAILVVDANTGAFEKGLKGQTKEHTLLLRSLGVQRIIVAINKLDMVGWSQDRFDEIAQQTSGFLTTTGFLPKNISFVPVSGLHGDNLVTRSQAEEAAWYTGLTLIEELENSEPMTRALQKPFRMSISELFRSQLSQLTISGRIDAGTVQTGDAILVQPSGETAYIRSLEVDGETKDWAVAGQNASIGLAGIDPIHVRVGDIICPTKAPIEVSDTFTVKVLAFDHLMPMPVDVHRGRLHAAGFIESMPAILDKRTGAITKKRPKVVAPASVARIVVKLSVKVPLEAGQRVVIRSGGQTVAAGMLE